MNPYLLSLILGIVEGLTEFLPVSSTAHLRITEALLGHWSGNPGILEDGYWKMYTIVIQLGAILCLPIYFRKRILKFLGTFPRGESGNRTILTHPLTLTLIAFLVTAIPAWRLTKLIGKNLESLYVMGSALLIGGVVMWIVDVLFGWIPRAQPAAVRSGAAVAATVNAGPVPSGLSGNGEFSEPESPVAPGRHPVLATTPRMEDMKWWQAVWIGACQILSAVFPGTSRSMSTIAAGQVAGMSRPAALEFSFFLSIPTMIVATGYDFLKTVVLKKGAPGETLPPIHMDPQRWIVLAIGFAVSFVVAWAVVAWFMNWVRRRGFAPFAFYRIIVGAAVLIWAFKVAGA
ncbi:MAG TPA: undecaprenyl-diphosphate phosphatase [Tepidisphaeraceae bacterium]|nr:undecaprenyl-diphosphate phosphatase [Tepidisphaeraceae bacterium]